MLGLMYFAPFSYPLRNWTTAGTYVNQATITATLPAGTQARYVRLRATQSDGYWVKIHEFAVSGPQSAAITVSGSPAAASGSSLAAAADGDVDTAYRAANPPAAANTAIALFAPTAQRFASSKPPDRSRKLKVNGPSNASSTSTGSMASNPCAVITGDLMSHSAITEFAR